MPPRDVGDNIDLGRHVCRVHPLEELHLAQVAQHLGRGAGFGVDPHLLAQFGDLPVLLDVPMWREDERLGGVAVGQLAHVL